jgi:hypothetical protein
MTKLPIEAPVLQAAWTKPQPPAKPIVPPSDIEEPAPPPPPPPAQPLAADLELIENGSRVPVPLPFQPISPLELLASSNPHVLTVMLRQLADMKGAQPDTSNGALRVMSNLSEGFRTGQDVTPHMADVTVHLTGREDRRELMSALTDVLDDERMLEMFKSRAKFEDFLHSCQRRSDVTVTEGMAIQAYFNSELDKLFGRRGKRGAVDAVSREPHELVSKSNLPTQLHRKELQHKFADAAPQEREILRKLGYKVQQMVAKVTRTTTETVELVQQEDTPGASQ